MDNPTQEQTPPKLDSLTLGGQKTRKHDAGYSTFIRSMRIILPLTALSIIAVVISWNLLQDDDIAPVKTEASMTQTIGKNELLNPTFESMDDKNQPYTITAKRALQDTNDELVLLDQPMADIVLNSGNWLAIKSRQGAFRQESQRLLLKENVTLFHDDGYTVKTEELNVDLKAGTAQTDIPIRGHGPAGTLEANGMKANSKDGTLVFTGPATVVLYDAKGTSGKGLLKP